ncbi:MAG: cell division protein SepF [Clostridia bacterium]|nr:cell division protein SepF [Clostridia bacterium]
MGILNKIGDMIFGPEEYEDETAAEEIAEAKEEAPRAERRDFTSHRDEVKRDDDREFLRGSRKSKVVNITSTTQFKVVVIQPESFEEAREIAENLKANKPVIVNLEKIEKEQARRMVDFVSGASYALGGDIQKISNMIFLVTPYNVGILGDFKDELKNKGIFPWSY